MYICLYTSRYIGTSVHLYITGWHRGDRLLLIGCTPTTIIQTEQWWGKRFNDFALHRVGELYSYTL